MKPTLFTLRLKIEYEQRSLSKTPRGSLVHSHYLKLLGFFSSLFFLTVQEDGTWHHLPGSTRLIRAHPVTEREAHRLCNVTTPKPALNFHPEHRNYTSKLQMCISPYAARCS